MRDGAEMLTGTQKEKGRAFKNLVEAMENDRRRD